MEHTELLNELIYWLIYSFIDLFIDWFLHLFVFFTPYSRIRQWPALSCEETGEEPGVNQDYTQFTEKSSHKRPENKPAWPGFIPSEARGHYHAVFMEAPYFLTLHFSVFDYYVIYAVFKTFFLELRDFLK